MTAILPKLREAGETLREIGQQVIDPPHLREWYSGQAQACLDAHALLSSPALASVLEERKRQDGKWGEQNHDPFTYLTILTEEVGETSQAALHLKFGGPAGSKLREEAVQMAAVALAIVECLDRGVWRWPEKGLTP